MTFHQAVFLCVLSALLTVASAIALKASQKMSSKMDSVFEKVIELRVSIATIEQRLLAIERYLGSNGNVLGKAQ